MDFELILKGAYASADAAIAAELERMPDDPNAFDCGFAWVVVKPATGPFVRWCKAQQKTLGVHYKDRYNLSTLDGNNRPTNAQYNSAKRLGSPHAMMTAATRGVAMASCRSWALENMNRKAGNH